jgi:hypothetical protein
MKKVRCAVGMLGVAVPVFGALAPAASAAVTQHSDKPGSKTVSFHQPAAAVPQAHRPCGGSLPLSVEKGPIVGVVWIYYNTIPCVDHTTVSLDHSQTGLEMRTRIFENSTRVFQGYVHGSIFVGTTAFNESNFVENATKACEALVYSTDIGRVAYGSVCENVPQPG